MKESVFSDSNYCISFSLILHFGRYCYRAAISRILYISTNYLA